MDKDEASVLETLAFMGRPATVPEIAKVMGERISDSKLYAVLGRLQDKGRVGREESDVVVHGTTLKRVHWAAVEQSGVGCPPK